MRCRIFLWYVVSYDTVLCFSTGTEYFLLISAKKLDKVGVENKFWAVQPTLYYVVPIFILNEDEDPFSLGEKKLRCDNL